MLLPGECCFRKGGEAGLPEAGASELGCDAEGVLPEGRSGGGTGREPGGGQMLPEEGDTPALSCRVTGPPRSPASASGRVGTDRCQWAPALGPE